MLDPIYSILPNVSWKGYALKILNSVTYQENYTYDFLVSLMDTTIQDPDAAAALNFLTTCEHHIFNIYGVIIVDDAYKVLEMAEFARAVQGECFEVDDVFYDPKTTSVHLIYKNCRDIT
jgi:hypothetical protein